MQTAANLRHTAGPLRGVFDKFLGDDGPAIVVDRDRYGSAELERGRRAWTIRLFEEYRSMVTFSALVGDLAEVRAPLDVVGAATRIVRDEMVHVELCRSLAEALGGLDASVPEPRWNQRRPATPARERVLRTLLASMCVGESVSVALLAAVRDHTADPATRGLLDRLYKDESLHARFGFLAFDALFGDRSREEAALIDRLLPRVLATIERQVLEAAPARPGYRDSPFGSIPPDVRREALRGAIEERVVPELEARGVAARHAWQQRTPPASKE